MGMSEYLGICPRNHRMYLRLDLRYGAATPMICRYRVEGEDPRRGTHRGENGPWLEHCGQSLELFRLPPIEITEWLRAKYERDGWTRLWPWPGPRFLMQRYLDPATLQEEQQGQQQEQGADQ